jgi:TusA-related sulfurtransferase
MLFKTKGEDSMVAIKTHFDGQTIKVPKELRNAPPGEVLVIVHDQTPTADDAPWLKAQESAFAKVWDNDEDAVYDSL